MGEELEKQVYLNMKRAVDEMVASLASASQDDILALDPGMRLFRQQKQIMLQTATIEYLLSQFARLMSVDTIKNGNGKTSPSSGFQVDMVIASLSRAISSLQSVTQHPASTAAFSDANAAVKVEEGAGKSAEQQNSDQTMRKFEERGTTEPKSKKKPKKRKMSPGISKKPMIECDICLKPFPNKEKLSRHRLVHTRPFHCLVCSATSAEKFKLRRHCAQMHGNSELFEDVRQRACTSITMEKKGSNVFRKTSQLPPVQREAVNEEAESSKLYEVCGAIVNWDDVPIKTEEVRESKGTENVSEMSDAGDIWHVSQGRGVDRDPLQENDPSSEAGFDDSLAKNQCEVEEDANDSNELIIAVDEEIVEMDGIVPRVEIDAPRFYAEVHFESNEQVLDSAKRDQPSPRREFQDLIPLATVHLDKLDPTIYVLGPILEDEEEMSLDEGNEVQSIYLI